MVIYDYASANILDTTVTLILEFRTPKFDAFILAPKSVSRKSLAKLHKKNTQDILLTMFVWDSCTHALTDA